MDGAAGQRLRDRELQHRNQRRGDRRGLRRREGDRRRPRERLGLLEAVHAPLDLYRELRLGAAAGPGHQV